MRGQLNLVGTLCVAVGLAAWGCGSDSTDTNPSGAGGSAGTSAAGSAGAAASGGEAGQGGTGTGGTGAEADASTDAEGPSGPGAGEACDVYAQNCVDPAAPKCEVDYSDRVNIPTFCGELLGTQQVNEPCVRPNNVVGEDTCDIGLICSNLGRPALTDRICRRFCKSSDECEPDEFCTVLNSGGGAPLPANVRLVGYCAGPNCDFFDTTTCPGTATCLTTTSMENVSTPVCTWSNSKQKGEACTSNNDCAHGLLCLSSTSKCAPMCGNAHPTCDTTETCAMINTAMDLGVCVPN